jgi:TetR/AcrR family transcriptional repressor of nem operon
MKVSRDQMAQNRRRILCEASRLFRERGFAAVTVADVMKASGQTHGGFYGHFASKDDLVAATVADTLAGEAMAMADVEAWTDAYLSGTGLSDGGPRRADAAPDARGAGGDGTRLGRAHHALR